MPLEQLIKKSDNQLKDKDYLGAIATVGDALKESPTAFLAYLKRATAYQMLSNYEAAKKDISTAFTIVHQRGKRAEIGMCYFRLGLIYYSEKSFRLALQNIDKAIEYDCPEATVQAWKTKCEYDVKKMSLESEDEVVQAQLDNSKTEPPSTSIEAINSHAPIKEKIRNDWFQTNDALNVTIYAKNVNKDELNVTFTARSVAVSFPRPDNSEYSYSLEPLFAEINPDTSSFTVYATKVEISLKKKEKNVKWKSLESLGGAPTSITSTAPPQSAPKSATSSSSLAYPSSSKKPINWSSFNVEEDDENDQGGEDFFAQLYSNTDDDTRRAMMKSYVESNGTVLTTNWDEAKAKKFETSPPEGMVARKWDDKT